MIFIDVKDAWEGKKPYVVFSKIGPFKVFIRDVFNTGPQRELESEVINAYLSLLIKKYNDNNAGRACAVDTFEMTRIWDGLKPKVKIVPQLYKLIVGIVNAGPHWMLVMILPGDKKTVLLDPLGGRKTSINHCKDVTRSFMRHRGLNVSRWACETRSHPLQHNATSCGAYALK
ncbi:unnamed protein product, partial [Menidia menidia]